MFEHIFQSIELLALWLDHNKTCSWWKTYIKQGKETMLPSSSPIPQTVATHIQDSDSYYVNAL